MSVVVVVVVAAKPKLKRKSARERIFIESMMMDFAELFRETGVRKV